jgi:hypothetical protein
LITLETAEIETGKAEKSSWGNRKKISQIIKDYFYILTVVNYFMVCGHVPGVKAGREGGVE